MLIEIGQKAKETSYILGKMGTDLKNAGLLAAAQEILDEEDEILKANAADVAKAKERGMAPGLVDRLVDDSDNTEGHPFLADQEAVRAPLHGDHLSHRILETYDLAHALHDSLDPLVVQLQAVHKSRSHSSFFRFCDICRVGF